MKTILVVEDFVAAQHFLREMLESKGYHTRGANNGQRAIEVLANCPNIDLVLTDYHMPVSNGYDLLLKIKSNPETSRIPVIFLTAESNPQAKESCKELGFTSWIKKPYRVETLLEEIEKSLHQKTIQWGLFH
jgi:CheY-like chemotaxis protein